jgi:hypothetical protein
MSEKFVGFYGRCDGVSRSRARHIRTSMIDLYYNGFSCNEDERVSIFDH